MNSEILCKIWCICMFFWKECCAFNNSQTSGPEEFYKLLPYWFSDRLNHMLCVRPIHLLNETTQILLRTDFC